jgi:hypothetical protein
MPTKRVYGTRHNRSRRPNNARQHVVEKARENILNIRFCRSVYVLKQEDRSRTGLTTPAADHDKRELHRH